MSVNPNPTFRAINHSGRSRQCGGRTLVTIKDTLTGPSQGQEVKAKAGRALPNALSDTRRASSSESIIKIY